MIQTNGGKTIGSRKCALTIGYIQKEHIVGPENDHATRKFHGHDDWIRALGFITCKKDPQTCTKSNQQRNQTNGVKTVGSRK
jgi:hypothetical protein